MTQVTLPKLNQTGVNEWSDVEDNDNAIITVVNGGLDNSNIAASAGIVDTKLASPNNSVYRTIFQAGGHFVGDAGAGTYILGLPMVQISSQVPVGIAPSATALGVGQTFGIVHPDHVFYFDDADYTVAGMTQKLRLRAQVMANATQPAITFTFGLYPITVAGGADAITYTLGTVVTSSTVAAASPTASTANSYVNSDFTVPADGAYALGVVTDATLTNNASVSLHAQLQHRNV